MKISHDHRGLKLWGFFLLGLPVTSLILLLSQVDWTTLRQQLSQSPSRLEAPYRYPFTEYVTGRVSLTALPLREIDFYQERVRLDPQGGLNRASLAMAYFKMGRATQEESWYLLAEQQARRSLASLPFDNPEAIQVLARVAETRHNFREALHLAAQLRGSTGGLIVQVTSNLALGNLPAARQAVTQLVDRDPNTATLTLQALVENAVGAEKTALQSFRQALEMEQPGELISSARVRIFLGRFYAQRGQLERARDLYQESLRIIPAYPFALVQLAQLETRRGNYSSAADYYQAALVRFPDRTTVFTPLILRGQAQLRQLQGDRTGAEKLWQQAEVLLRGSLKPTASTFGHRRDLAQLLLERGNPQDLPEAIALMKQEVKLRRDAQTLDTFAWALSRNGQWQAAQSALQSALALGTKDAVIFQRAGTIAQALGNRSQSEQYFQQAKAVDPSFTPRFDLFQGLGTGL